MPLKERLQAASNLGTCTLPEHRRPLVWQSSLSLLGQNGRGRRGCEAEQAEERAGHGGRQSAQEGRQQAPRTGGNGEGGQHTSLSRLGEDLGHSHQDAAEAHIHTETAYDCKGEDEWAARHSEAAEQQAQGRQEEATALDPLPPKDVCTRSCQKAHNVRAVQKHGTAIHIG